MPSPEPGPAHPVGSGARRGWLLLTGLVAVYVGFRVALLLGAFEAIALPTYELHNMGNLARLTSLGAAGPPLWMHFDNAGGQQLTALLAAPLYALFGSSYLVLKLVPMLLGLVALLLLWTTMRREFGLAAAAVSGALFVLGPPTLVKYSLLASGNHFENVVFALALFALFSAGHRRQWGWWLPLALGLLAGFALFVYPGAVVPVAIFTLLQVCVRGLRGAVRDLPAALVGLLIGLGPLLAFNAASGGRTFQFASRNLGGADESLLERLAGNAQVILGDLLPRAGCYEPVLGMDGDVGETLGLAAFVLCWLVLAPQVLAGLVRQGRLADRAARWRALHGAPMLLYLPVLVLIIGFGRWDFDAYEPPLEVGQFRYFVPHFVFVAALAGAAVQTLRAQGKAGRALATLLTVALLLPSLFTLPIARPWPGTAGAGLRYEGHHFPYYGRILLAYTERDGQTGELLPDFEQLRGWLEGMPRRHAYDVWSGVAHTVTTSRLAPHGRPSATPERSVQLPGFGADFDPGVSVAWARGVGACLRRMGTGNALARETLQRLLLRLERTGHPLTGWVCEGLGYEYQFTLAREVELHLAPTLACAELVPVAQRAAYRHGLGAQLGRLLARGIELDVEVVQRALTELPDERARDIGRGLGWGVAEVAGATGWANVIETAVPAKLQRAAVMGAGACRRHLEGIEVTSPDGLRDAWRAAFDEGVARSGTGRPWWEQG